MDRLSGRSGSNALVQLSVKEGITAEVVHRSLDRLFELSGCTNCGLLGFDLHILTIDDDWSRQFGKLLEMQREIPKLEGLESVSVLGR